MNSGCPPVWHKGLSDAYFHSIPTTNFRMGKTFSVKLFQDNLSSVSILYPSERGVPLCLSFGATPSIE